MRWAGFQGLEADPSNLVGTFSKWVILVGNQEGGEAAGSSSNAGRCVQRAGHITLDGAEEAPEVS